MAGAGIPGKPVAARAALALAALCAAACGSGAAAAPSTANVDIDPSGSVLTFVDSHFGSNGQPQDAMLVMARWNGPQFVRSAESAAVLAAVNAGSALQYAPALAADRLTLWFTRVASVTGAERPQIWRARRSTESAPFEAPVRIDGLGDFVEAPALSADEKLLYFHRKVGAGFRIFAVATP